MARRGETEHGSAVPKGGLPRPSQGRTGSEPPVVRVASSSTLSSSNPPADDPRPEPPPGYLAPQAPPPPFPPPPYPPSYPAYPSPSPPGHSAGGGPGTWPPPQPGWPVPPGHSTGGGPGTWPPPKPGWPVPPGQDGGRFFDLPGTPPATRGAAGWWLLMGLVGFLVGQLFGAVFVAIAAAVTGESGQLSRFATMAAPPEWYVGTSLVGLWVGFFLGPWVASRFRGTGRLFSDLGVRFRVVDLAGIPLGLAGQLVLDALYAPFVGHLKHFTAPTHKLVGAAHGWGFLVIAILTVCGAPFFEEILFRGLALKALARLFAPSSPAPTKRRAAAVAAAVVVDGGLFGLAHWELYQFAGLAVFGMLLATVSYKTGRLGMNMVAHASFNLVAVLAVLSASGGVLH